MKNTIIELLKSTEREGIENLINYMEAADFFKAPASSQHYLAKEGGLAEHSFNVYDLMINLCDTLLTEIPVNSIIITGLLHDIGKAAYHTKPLYVPNILKSGKISEAKPYEHNKERLITNHEVASLTIISRYIKLTEEEAFAILYHNGMYTSLGREISGKETQLQQLLHFADMWCSRFIE